MDEEKQAPVVDGVEASIAALTGAMTALAERVEKADAATETTVRGIIDKFDAGAVVTPTLKVEPRIVLADPLRSMGLGCRVAGVPDTFSDDTFLADIEMAMMLFDGATRTRKPSNITPPEILRNAFQRLVLERPAPPMIVDDRGRPLRAIGHGPDGKMRAMDTAESGFGADLVQTSWSPELWRAARDADPLVETIRQVTMPQATHDIPIDTSLPEMLYVGESASNAASNYDTSKAGSSNRTLSAKKFTIQSIWSGELNEDSIIPYTPFLREQLAESLAQHLGSAMYNGDTTNAGTGNINLDDANPADTKHYLAFNGIRYLSLVADASGLDVAAGLSLDDLWTMRGRMKVGDDDIDNALDNRNWGRNLNDLLLVCDWDTYMAMLKFDEVRTVDKYGPVAATAIAGELARIAGIRIVSPAYATKTEADGKASTTEASNTKGQVTLLNTRGWIRGVKRDMQLFFDRLQRSDQFLFEMYVRVGFINHGAKVAVTAYDITV